MAWTTLPLQPKRRLATGQNLAKDRILVRSDFGSVRISRPGSLGPETYI